MPNRVRKPFIALSLMLFLVVLLQCSMSLTQEGRMGGALPFLIPDQSTFELSYEPIEDQTPPETVVELIGTVGADGWFVSRPTVYLVSTDVESGVNETFFSFDGETWNVYSGPFLLMTPEGYSTLYYFSTDLAGNIETTKIKTIKLDTLAPLTMMTPDGNLGYFGWYVSPVTVTLTAIDETSGVAYTEYSFDGAGWTPYLKPTEISKDGSNLLMFRSVDMAGNTEVAESAAIAIDRSPPTTNLTLSGSKGSEGWYLSNVIVTFIPVDTASGVADTEYSYDGITWTSYLEPLVISNEGVSTIYFWSADFAGNTEETKSVSISIDKTSPETAHEFAGVSGLSGWYVTNVSVMLTATDGGSGVSYTEYSFDGISWYGYVGSFVISSEGVWTLYYRSVDVAGNVEIASSVEVAVDKSPPETELDTESYFADGLVVLTATDSVSGVADTYCRVNEGEWMRYVEPFPLEREGNAYVIDYYSVDKAGNLESAKTTTLTLEELKVISFVSDHRFSPRHYRLLDSLDVYFVKSGWHGYRLVTKGEQFWYNIEVTNLMSASILMFTITPDLPSQFQMTRLAVWVEISPEHFALAYVYLNRTHGCPRVICPHRTLPVSVSFDGNAVTVVNLTAGARVWVAIEMDYGLRNAFFRSPEQFTTESYTFSAAAQVMGAYHSSYNLPVVNHGAKCHYMHHWSCHFWVAAGHRYHC
ncbi:MAG: hypothetical protein C4K49_03155 [Candidatus Thorarchaeota archaeon]|nr:MAG: hypothetical protein C4K49_03155 [Candidatus Thorarchaeota archaeon]